MIARRSRRLAKHGGSDRRGCAIAGTARYAPRTQPAPEGRANTWGMDTLPQLQASLG